MGLAEVVLLALAGLAAGFVAGLVGVGGGIVFAPVLFFYFEAIGVEPGVLTPLTLGTSLFCTLLAALVSTWYQLKQQSVRLRMAVVVGLMSALAVVVVTRFVTTQPWYDATVFQIVFSTVLLLVVFRMIRGGRGRGKQALAEGAEARAGKNFSWPLLGGIGSAAGAVSSAVGVGGGVVLVPAYANILRLPIRLATGTSSATIVLISLAGVLTYLLTGLGQPAPPFAVGYVDFGHGLLLAVPALYSARLGVRAAHRIPAHLVRWSFAAVAAVVAFRLIWRALG